MATPAPSNLASPGGPSRTDRVRAVDHLRYPAEVRQALGGLDRPFVATPGARLEGARLSPAEGFVLSRLDSPMTADQIHQVTPLPAEVVERSLLRLVVVGAVVPASASGTRSSDSFDERAAEAAALLAAATPSEVLGVPVGASRDQVKKAYLTLVRRFHPDSLAGAPAEVRRATDAVFLRLGAAYESLLSAAKRMEESAPLPREQATAAPVAPVDPVALQGPTVVTSAEPAPSATPNPEESPEELLRQAEQKLLDRPWETLAIAARVIATAKGPRRQRARLLQAQAKLRNPSIVREGELELRSILHEDPRCMEASLALARFYKDLGLAARSAALLRRALEIDPRNAAATAALRDLKLAGQGVS